GGLDAELGTHLHHQQVGGGVERHVDGRKPGRLGGVEIQVAGEARDVDVDEPVAEGPGNAGDKRDNGKGGLPPAGMARREGAARKERPFVRREFISRGPRVAHVTACPCLAKRAFSASIWTRGTPMRRATASSQTVVSRSWRRLTVSRRRLSRRASVSGRAGRKPKKSRNLATNRFGRRSVRASSRMPSQTAIDSCAPKSSDGAVAIASRTRWLEVRMSAAGKR